MAQVLRPLTDRFQASDYPALLVGLNTNHENTGVSEFARGMLGIGQLLELEHIVTEREHDGMARLVYLHHRPQRCSWFMDLADAEDLLAIAHNRVELLAFGHSGGAMANGQEDPADAMNVIRRDFGVRYFLNADRCVALQRYHEIRIQGREVSVRLC